MAPKKSTETSKKSTETSAAPRNSPLKKSTATATTSMPLRGTATSIQPVLNLSDEETRQRLKVVIDSVDARENVLKDEIIELGQVIKYNEDGELCLIKTNMTPKTSGFNEERVVSYFLQRRLNVAETTARMMKDGTPYENVGDLFWALTKNAKPRKYKPGMDMSDSFPPPN